MKKQDTFSIIYSVGPGKYENYRIECANFSIRTYKRLKSVGIYTIADLLRKSKSDLMVLSGFGDGCLKEVEKYISSLSKGTKNDTFATLYELDSEEYANYGIENANFSHRTYGILKRNKVDSIADILKKNRTELTSLIGFGKYSYNEVMRFISSLSKGVNGNSVLFESVQNQYQVSSDQIKPPFNVVQTMLIPENKTFAFIYGIDPQEYINTEIDSDYFSVRTYRRLRSIEIYTVADLLGKSKYDLFSIKGFGANCFDEVIRYFTSLRSNMDDNFCSQKLPDWALEQKDLLFEGKFNEINPEYLKKDKDFIDSVKEAYITLGKELVGEIHNNPALIHEYIRVFDIFYKSCNIRKKCLVPLIELKPNKRVYPYIVAFSDSYDERNALYSFFTDEKCTFCDIALNGDCKIETLIVKFLNWCQFDLYNEFNSFLNSFNDRERTEAILTLRSHHSTLEEVGSILGVTRERIRQIEAKIARKFELWEKSHNYLSKIAAECGCYSVIPVRLLSENVKEYSDIILHLLQIAESDQYNVDIGLGIIALDDPDYSVRIRNYVDSLPEEFDVRELPARVQAFPGKVSEDIMIRAVEMQYQLTGNVYHKNNLSIRNICESILEKYYPNGIHIYDNKEIEAFRNRIYLDYGDIKISDTDRALQARITSVAVLCGRGRYKSKQDRYISFALSEKIKKYIENSKYTIFLINSLYLIFESELADEGIDNRYYFQGILKELLGGQYYISKDYLSKDAEATSYYSLIVDFIKNSKVPVTRNEIMDKFQGLTEIVLNAAVSDHEILNYFGMYIYVGNIKLYDEDYSYVKKLVNKFLAQNEILHIKDLFEYIKADHPDFIDRTGATYPFRLFSLMEYILSEDYQFARPYIAQMDTVIDRPMERFSELLERQDITHVQELLNVASECHFQMMGMYDFLNMFSKTHFILDKEHLIKISATGIDEDVARKIEALITEEIRGGTEIISQLKCRKLFPKTNVEWDEWIIASVINKWSDLLEVGLSSRNFKDAVALVAPTGRLKTDEFSDVLADTNYKLDNLDNIDDLIVDILGEEIEV